MDIKYKSMGGRLNVIDLEKYQKKEKLFLEILKKMTTEDKLQSVTDRIRKDIPRLMELSDGCYVKLADHIKTNNSENIVKVVNAFTFERKDIVKIIGHEPMLNDVLEFVNKTSKNFRKLLIDDDGLIYKFTMGGAIEFIEDVKWSFEKQYLKDQSKELISFLHNIDKL